MRFVYGVNDTVLYKAHGVCRITAITEKEINGRSQEYFVLKPVFDDKSTIFLPVQNKKTSERMRRVLSADEIYSLIKAMPNERTIWIDNESDRKQQYKKIIAGGDRTALVSLIKTLYLHQQEQRVIGKKFHVSDENFMKDAEKMLYEEFAHVLDINRDQVLPFILELVDFTEQKS
jgi:CarD family transcriptional regulator